MRSRGYTRPLSVLQIRTDVRNKCNKMKQETLLDMLTPEGTVSSSCVVVLHAQFSVSSDGTIHGKVPNPAVPQEVLLQVRDGLRNGSSMNEIVDLLRAKTVPAGYTPHPWKPGT